MSKDEIIYICPRCFRTSDEEEICHEHVMLRCDVGAAGGNRRRPLVDSRGHMQTRAPRWFVEARNALAKDVFYICPTCFRVSHRQVECHGRMMVCCDAGEPQDERRKPALDAEGQLKSRAPRWFQDAISRRERESSS